MKCLEKDRTRRYESANGLAADLRRHLKDEPVAAGPPSAAYQLRKFASLPRGMFIAVGAVATALILGLAATSIGFIRANLARHSLADAAGVRTTGATKRICRNRKRGASSTLPGAGLVARHAFRGRCTGHGRPLVRGGRSLSAQTLDAFERLKLPTLPVEFSMFGHYASSPPPLMTYPLPQVGRVVTVKFSKIGRKALTEDFGRNLHLVDLATGAMLRTIQLPEDAHGAGAAWSPDETSVICGGPTALWKIDLLTGKAVWTQPLASPGYWVAGSADGSKVVVGRIDLTFEVRDAQTGRKIREFRGPSDERLRRRCRTVHARWQDGAPWSNRGRRRNGCGTSRPENCCGRSFTDRKLAAWQSAAMARPSLPAPAAGNTDVRIWDLQSGAGCFARFTRRRAPLPRRSRRTIALSPAGVWAPPSLSLISRPARQRRCWIGMARLFWTWRFRPMAGCSFRPAMTNTFSFGACDPILKSQRSRPAMCAAGPFARWPTCRDAWLKGNVISLWNLATGQRLETYDSGGLNRRPNVVLTRRPNACPDDRGLAG